MMPKERRIKIIDILYTDKRATVIGLCKSLNSSEATIRRDLTILEEEGKLERTHGGAIMKSNIPVEAENSFNEKEGMLLFEKNKLQKWLSLF